MTKTEAHEIAEQFTNIQSDDATVIEMSDGSYIVDLSSDVTVSVNADGSCALQT